MSYSRYFLADLQVHTPADSQHAYGDWGGKEPNPDFAKRLVATCRERGLSVVAVTDHNRVDWYPCLRDEGDKHGVYVFPGVEVSVNRCHLLVVWDRTVEGFNLANQFLASCWAPGAPRFKENGDPLPVTEGQVLNVAQRAVRHKGLVLAPHSTQRAIGFFANGVCTNRSEVIRKNVIAGFDIHGNVAADVLKNPASEFSDLPVAWFISGDTRSFEDVGRRACYLKLGAEPSLEGLRQAFLMPETRIRLPESLRETWSHVVGVRFLPTPTPTWPRITSVRIDGGFHDGLEFELAPGLNAIIGGKGTGKSALMEIIRYGSEAQDTTQEDLRANRRQNFRANAEVRLSVVDAQSQPYTAVRVGDNTPGRLLSTGEDTGVPIGRRFSIRVLGQRELQQLANEQQILRDFVASTSGPEWDDTEADTKRLRQDLEDLNSGLQTLDSTLRRLEAKESDLADLKERLEQARRAGAEGLLNTGEALTALNVQVQAALTWPASVDAALSQLSGILPAPEIPDTPEVPGAIASELARLATVVETTASNLAGEIQVTNEVLAAPRESWNSHVEGASAEIARSLAEIGIADAQELTRIQSQVATLQEELKDLPTHKKSQADLEKKRAASVAALGDVARRRSRIVEVAARALNEKLSGRVRLIVEPLADKSVLVSWLKEALQGANVATAQLERIAAHPSTAIVKAVRDGTDSLVGLGCSTSTAAKVIERLDGAKLRTLEEIVTPDRIRAEVNLGTVDAEAWRPVEAVSPGQRATALLALVLLSTSEPLLIDQPEDDLDNPHIYNDVVRVLADVCQGRQVIVATHNANIAVLGDAELVVALEADAERGHLQAIGGFEDPEVASHARRILEGGEEAFRARQRRYRPHETGDPT